MTKRPYHVALKGRETSHEDFALYDDAKWRADELAKETGREARVYDERKGTYAAPIYRTGQASR